SQGTVQFPIDGPMPLDTVKEMVRFRVKENLAQVKEVFYVTEEEHGILPLPKISWTLQKTKYSLLKLVAEGLSDIDALKEELEISRTMTYMHLRDLKDQALIVETPNGYDLTLAGKLLLI
ncbi:MAG: hypothetical protein ACXWER_04185, partial [Halobacteriota archaeon]